MTTTLARDAPPDAGAVSRDQRRGLAGLAVWIGVVALGAATAAVLNLMGDRISIDAPPLHARFDVNVRPELVLALVVGILAVVALPVIAERARWRVLVPVSGIAAVSFGVALAASRGWDRVVAPVRSGGEYFAVLPRVRSAGAFLDTFTTRLPSYPVHVQGHPPGPVLLAIGLRAIGLGSPGWFAALLVAGGALMAPATLVVVREVAGEQWARSAMPFLIAGPAAVWLVTSADALFAGIGAVGIALVVAATGRRAPRGDLLAIAGGTVLGATAFLSYGLVLLAGIPLVVAWRRRTARPVAFAALGAGAVAGAFSVAGFWWWDGLMATHHQYVVGIASRRPYLAFVAVDLAAFALALGPAFAVGVARLRDRRMWLLVGAGLVVVAAALLSGMAKGEVERIWLPFIPWLLVAAAASAPAVANKKRGPRLMGRAPSMGWLGAQVLLAILIESVVRTPW